MNKRKTHLNKGTVNKCKARTESFGRLLKGDLFTITKENGRFRFLGAVEEEGTILWIDAFGPIDTGKEQLRSFRPERIQMPSQRRLNTLRRTKGER